MENRQVWRPVACIASFPIIEDPRTGGNKLHHFGEVLFMAVSAMFCGLNWFFDIEDFCDVQTDWLRKWIKMPNGVPRAQTFSNIFALKCYQGNLHKEARDQFHFAHRNLDLQHSEGWSYDQRMEKFNGRIVTRSVTVGDRLDSMDTGIRGRWRNLRSLIHRDTQTNQLGRATRSTGKSVTNSAASTNRPPRSRATSGGIGASRTAATGSWTPHSEKTTTQPISGTPQKTSAPCAGSFSISLKSIYPIPVACPRNAAAPCLTSLTAIFCSHQLDRRGT